MSSWAFLVVASFFSFEISARRVISLSRFSRHSLCV